MADYFCVSMIHSRCLQIACLQPFALAIVNIRACHAVTHVHVCNTISFV